MIVPLALRLSAKNALVRATSAGDRVFDSAISSIEDMIKEGPQPFVVVSTDDQAFNITGFDLAGGSSRQVDIVIDVAVGSTVKMEDGEDLAVMIPHTDAGTELSVNIITRQALRALFEPNSGGAWGKMFRRIAQQATRVLIRRGAGSQKGVKFAAAQIVISVQPLFEPAFGLAPRDVWADFIAQVRADPVVAPLASALEAAIVGDAIPDWKALSSIAGLNDEAATAIGVLPLGGEGSVWVSEQVVSPDGWIDNAATVAENVPGAP
jgi:hypothetical protein